jgi:type II secretory ATPase GspE/PulE/Tfp pilus assembly ATPase PilB-like protein
MPVNAQLVDLIAAGKPEEELDRVRQSQGHASLRDDAAGKLLAGQIAFADAMEAVELF